MEVIGLAMMVVMNKGTNRERSQKRQRVEENGRIDDSVKRRKGIFWRGNPRRCVVEMRLPTKSYKSPQTFNFGTYRTVSDAMVARDFAAFVRARTGEEPATAGGFKFEEHPSIYYYEESFDFFAGSEKCLPLCNEFERLLKNPNKEAHDAFCENARTFLDNVAIGLFRRKYPGKFDESADCEAHLTPGASTSEARVSPDAGFAVHAVGSTSDVFEEFEISFKDSFLKTPLRVTVPRVLSREVVDKIVTEGVERMRGQLDDTMKSIRGEILAEVVGIVPELTIAPESFPALDFEHGEDGDI